MYNFDTQEKKMSTFFERIKNKVFRAGNHGSAGTKRKKFFHNIKFDENPEETWKTVGEIGDGSFGKVYKVCLLIEFFFLEKENLR